jgi:hypothetical protein
MADGDVSTKLEEERNYGECGNSAEGQNRYECEMDVSRYLKDKDLTSSNTESAALFRIRI